MTAPYQPIACVQHERLEFAVLKRIPLWLRYRDTNGMHATVKVLPLDVETRDAAEWLSARFEDGHSEILRLDWLLDFSEQPFAGTHTASD
ncbi:MAG TPA: transcriptional antiterminator, Rof [Betaproteobacteria bacterium]|nr:transcriptional antiterminator, Rof [Betaproteobacteria bacterium]